MTTARRVPPYGDSPSKVRGRRGGPLPAPTGIWIGNTGQLPRAGEATSAAARATHLLHFGFKVHAGRRRGSVQRPRALLRGLGRRRRSYTHTAPSNFRSPIRLRLGPGTKRPWQPMAAGQCQEAANQRAPHAPSRPEQGERRGSEGAGP